MMHNSRLEEIKKLIYKNSKNNDINIIENLPTKGFFSKNQLKSQNDKNEIGKKSKKSRNSKKKKLGKKIDIKSEKTFPKIFVPFFVYSLKDKDVCNF